MVREYTWTQVLSFDHVTVALMGRVCDEAWREVQDKNFFPSQSGAEAYRQELATRVMAAVVAGETDAARLKAIALECVEA